MSPGTVRTRVRRRLRKEGIRAYQAILPRPRERKILVIVGCQRSGTTALQRSIRGDVRCKSFGEFSALSQRDPQGLRLDPLDEVAAEIDRSKAPFVVMKPLVESQRVPELLDHLPNSAAVWMYRNYRDVARSNIAKWGPDNGITDIAPIAEGATDNWRSELVSDQVRELIRQSYRPDMPSHDAAVLFWLARNSIVFELDLAADTRVMMLSYDDFVAHPADSLRYIYDGVGRPYPGDRLVADIHDRSIRRGVDVEISPTIDEAANDMLRRLDAIKATKYPSPND